MEERSCQQTMQRRRWPELPVIDRSNSPRMVARPVFASTIVLSSMPAVQRPGCTSTSVPGRRPTRERWADRIAPAALRGSASTFLLAAVAQVTAEGVDRALLGHGDRQAAVRLFDADDVPDRRAVPWRDENRPAAPRPRRPQPAPCPPLGARKWAAALVTPPCPAGQRTCLPPLVLAAAAAAEHESRARARATPLLLLQIAGARDYMHAA